MKRYQRNWCWLAVGAALCASALPLAAQTAPAASQPGVTVAAPRDAAWAGEWVFVLNGGAPNGRPLTMHIDHSNGQFTDAWATAFQYNQSLHNVRITSCDVKEDTVTLKMQVEFRPDFWIKGGQGEFTLTLQRKPVENPVVSVHSRLRTSLAHAALSGTFTGSFTPPPGAPKTVFGNPIEEPDPQPTGKEGTIEGVIVPARETAAGFQLPKFNEHPRMLFRAGDVPALKAKLNDTPLGQAVLAELKSCDHEVAEGLLYKLTGDVDKAKAGLARIKTLMVDETKTRTKGYGGMESEHVADYPAGHQACAAMFYDLTVETLNAEDKREMRKWFRFVADMGLLKPWNYSNKGSTASPASPTGRLVWAGASMVAFNLWGSEAPAPPEPKFNPFELKMLESDPANKEKMVERLAKAREQWQHDLAIWKQNNGMDLGVQQLNSFARRGLACAIHEQVGEGGTMDHRAMLDANIIYRNMFGKPITGRGELSRAAILPLIRSALWDTRKASRVDNALDVDGSTLVRLLVLSEPQWRPAIQYHWLKRLQMTAADLETVDGARKFLQKSFPNRGPGTEDPLGLLYTLQYLDPKNTTPPTLPSVWDIATRGEYLFRTGGMDDPVLLSIDANTSKSMGATLSAGTFEIFAFGQRWTGSIPWGSEVRGRHNVLYSPGFRTSYGALGRIAFRDITMKQSTAAVTIDCNALVREEIETTVEKVETVKVGEVTMPRTVTVEVTKSVEHGYKHARAFGVDVSGKCGAPMLLVIADRFDGDIKKTWVYNLPDHIPPAKQGRREPPFTPPFDVKTDATGFTLTKGNASLRATFVAPSPLKIEYVKQKTQIEPHFHPTRSAARGPQPFTRTGIEVTGEPATTGHFFAIITLQQGPAPEVKVEGTGLDAKVTIGGQRVRFDGQRVTIEPK